MGIGTVPLAHTLYLKSLHGARFPTHTHVKPRESNKTSRAVATT